MSNILYKGITVSFRVSRAPLRGPNKGDLGELCNLIGDLRQWPDVLTPASHILCHELWGAYPDVKRTVEYKRVDFEPTGQCEYELRTAIPYKRNTDEFMDELSAWFNQRGWVVAGIMPLETTNITEDNHSVLLA